MNEHGQQTNRLEKMTKFFGIRHFLNLNFHMFSVVCFCMTFSLWGNSPVFNCSGENTPFLFDGATYLKQEVPKNWGGSYTFLLWACPDKIPESRESLLCKVGFNTQISYNRSGTYRFSTYNSTREEFHVDSGYVLPGTWSLIAGVYDEQKSQIILYVNGKRVDEREMSGGQYKQTGSFIIGCANPKAEKPCYYTGKMDRVRVYANALSAAEILELYHQERLSFPEVVSKTVFTDSYVRAFTLSGPMPTAEADKIEQDVVAGKADTAKWLKFSAVSPIIDLCDLFHGRDLKDVSVFAIAELDVKEPVKGMIAVGSDDGMKLFLDGKHLKTAPSPRGCVPDTDKVEVDFHAGLNRVVLRIDNRGGAYAFVLRAGTTKEQMDKENNPPLAIRRDGTPLWKTLQIDKRSKAYFDAEPFLKREYPPKVRFGLMVDGFSCTQKEARPFYKDFCETIPCPDILELRTPVYALYDAKTLKQSEHIFDALKEAAATKAPEIELTAITTHFPFFATNREVAPNATEFFKAWFKDDLPDLMLDEQGRPVSAIDKRPYTMNSFSLHDPRIKKFSLDMAAKTAKILHKRKDLRVSRVNIRFPGPNDWYYSPSGNAFYDYSKSAQNAFREFLRAKYGSLEKLNAAYHSDYSDLKDLDAPKPKIGQMDISRPWQDWQEFRIKTVYDTQRSLVEAILKENPDVRITNWMTTGISPVARDGIILDDGMRLSREFPQVLEALTCFNYYNLAGELAGQLATAYGVEIAAEPEGDTPESYQRTLFNVLRFPIVKINWIFWGRGSTFGPNATPWVGWIMNQRALADELRGAELLQQRVVNVFPYSTLLFETTSTRWESKFLAPHLKLFRASQNAGIDMPMISDYSLPVDLGKYQGVLVAEGKLLKPEMIAKLGAFVRNGGKALLVGASGEYDLNSGKRDYPLLREFGVDASSVKPVADGLHLTALPAGGKALKSTQSAVEEAVWPLGKGEVIFHGLGVASLLDNKQQLNEAANSLMTRMGMAPLINIEQRGLVSSFVKARGKTRYLGFINLGISAFGTTAEFLPAKGIPSLPATELISGEKIELKEGKLPLSFDIPWQIKVFKVELN